MLTNRFIKDIIGEWKLECGVSHIVLFRYLTNGELIICTDRPGYMIGRAGEKVFKYKEIFKSMDKDFKKISFGETDGIA